MPPTTSVPRKKVIEKGPPGRPKHEVWTLGFRRVLKHCEKTHRTIHAAYCVICSKVLCNTASKRLSAHRRICSFESPDEAAATELLEKSVGAPGDSDNPNKLKEITKILDTSSGATTTITFVDMEDASQFVADQQQTVVAEGKTTEYQFIDNDGDFEEYTKNAFVITGDKVEQSFANFFIGCNIPFSVADSPHFRKFCLSLNPSLKPITSEQLSGPLLDSVYSKIHKDTKVSPTSVMMMDSWKNESTNTKNVTVMIKTDTNETIYLNNYELSATKDSNQELTDIAHSCILEACQQFRTDIYAVILGNGCTIKLDDNDVWEFPCNLQALNNLIKDYIPQDAMLTVCKVLKQLNMVIKDDDLENKISTEMRWINIKCILEYCITNLVTIQSILSDENYDVKLSKDYKGLFFDEDFVCQIESYIAFLDSICDLTAVCRMPKSNIADAAEQWLSLQLPQDEVNRKLETRREHVLTIHSLVANYLHPAYRGQKLTSDQMTKVEEFLVAQLDAEGLDSLNKYGSDEGIFNTLNQKENLTAKTYWSFSRRSHSSLANLALKLLTIPASITVNFSEIFNNIKINSLKPEKLRKLFTIYYHLKEKEEKMEVD